jgi:type I restriction enzyme, S subunit
MSIPMPPRNTTAEVVARAADKCLRLACAKHFPTVALGDVGEVISGGTPSTDRSDFWDGDIVWVTPKDLGRPRSIEVESAERTISKLGLESSSARLLPPGTVLLSSRAPIGHLGIAALPLATNQGFKNIICSKRLNSRYLFHILRGSIDELAAKGRGNTFMEIPGKVVKTFRLPLPSLPFQEAVATFLDALYQRVSGQQQELPHLPAPLAEQRRVVTRIEELAAQIREARTLRHEAAEEAEAFLSRAASHLLDESGWPITPLGNILVGSPRNGLSPKQQVETGGRGMLRINAVSSTPTRFVDMTALKRVEVSDQVAQPFVVQNDDVFIVRYNGDINRVAKPAIYKGKNDSRIVYPDKLMRLRPDPVQMTPDFLVFALKSRSVRDQIEEIGKTTAGNIGISGRDAKSFKVPLPPLAEQSRMVSELDALQAEVDALKRLQAETAAELDALLPSILDKAFKGEL